MRILVFGHSDSAGIQLPDASAAWPFVLQRLLAEDAKQQFELKHEVLVPLRADAVETVTAAVRAFEPDLVFLHLNPYSFAIQVVGLRVRQRFGKRAATWYRRCESRFDRATSQGRVRRHLNSGARWSARRIIGVAAIAAYPAVVGAYTNILHQLAHSEDLQVVVMGGSRLGTALQSVTPGMVDAIARFATEMEGVTREHRFIWFDTETSVAGPGRDELFLADGVHRSPQGHQRLAAMLLPVVQTIGLQE
ncbi:MAG: hypothetical protein ACRDG3_13430, partial [Tepidiformaceae bacterium]